MFFSRAWLICSVVQVIVGWVPWMKVSNLVEGQAEQVRVLVSVQMGTLTMLDGVGKVVGTVFLRICEVI